MKSKKILLIIPVIIILAVGVLSIILLTKGVSNKETNWTQDGLKITNGNETYNIGDNYNYDETNNGEYKNLTDVNWKVLGVNESGNLLIMSTIDVSKLTLGEKDNLELSKKDYVNGVNMLNEITKVYGNGKGALSARSITAEDINKLTNYDVNNYNKGEINEYNNKVTFYLDNENKAHYKGSNQVEGILSHDHKNFIWYDTNTKEWKKADNLNLSKTPTEIATITSNFYAYDNVKNYNTDELIIEKDSNIYNMLFIDEEGNNANYWLASPFTNASPQFIGYGYHVIKKDRINYLYLVYSPGYSRGNTYGVRAVVTIK